MLAGCLSCITVKWLSVRSVIAGTNPIDASKARGLELSRGYGHGKKVHHRAITVSNASQS